MRMGRLTFCDLERILRLERDADKAHSLIGQLLKAANAEGLSKLHNEPRNSLRIKFPGIREFSICVRLCN